jgi:hypothetical protein
MTTNAATMFNESVVYLRASAPAAVLQRQRLGPTGLFAEIDLTVGQLREIVVSDVVG